jgi:NAD-dependent deacetylase
VPTFRDAGGLWEGIASRRWRPPDASTATRRWCGGFYNLCRANPHRPSQRRHAALVELERHYGPENFAVITQNIDGLHQAAEARACWNCTVRLQLRLFIATLRRSPEPGLDDWRTAALRRLRTPAAAGHRLVRRRAAGGRLGTGDGHGVLISVLPGRRHQRAVVYPAAGLVSVAQSGGADVIEVNPNATEVTQRVAVSLQGPSGAGAAGVAAAGAAMSTEYRAST